MWRALLLFAGCGRINFDTRVVTGDAVATDILPTGLIHHWPIDEPVGATIIHDVIGGADATVMTPAMITANGHAGTGLDSVTGGYAFVPGTPADMASQSVLSIAAWMRRSVANGIEQVGQEDAGAIRGDELSIQLWSDGLAYYCIGPDCSTVTSNDTSWHHFVMVFDGSLAQSARITGYIDGVVQNVNPGAIPTTTPSRTDIHFDLGSTGRNEGSDTGTIDEVRVYNYALSPADVVLLFQNT
jgi:hypothetical protein